MKRIAVFCGSKHGNDPAFEQAAAELGKALATKNIEVVYGGGAVGLMGVVANAVLEENGKITGVIPEKLYEMEVAHMGLSELYRVKTMHERKALMADLSDGFIALPGGIGTLEEITEVITWAQIGYHNKACCFLNTSQYYDTFFQFFKHMEEEAFLYIPFTEAVIVENTVPALLDKLKIH